MSIIAGPCLTLRCAPYFTALLMAHLPLTAAGNWPSEPPAAEINEQTLARLRIGEVLVESTQLDESGGAARVQAMFLSSARDVWYILGDCETNYQFVDGLRDCELLESDERQAMTRQAVKKHFLLPRLDYVFETVREPYEWVSIRLVSGDLKTMQGSWRFDPVGDGEALIVTHNIRVQPKILVPRWLVRRTLRNDIGNMMACLRFLAGASIDEQGRRKDGVRCP